MTQPVTALLAATGGDGAIWQLQFDTTPGQQGATPVVACTDSGLLMSATLEGGRSGLADVEVLAREPGALVRIIEFLFKIR